MILLQIVFSYNVFGMGNFRGGEMIFLKKIIWLFSSKWIYDGREFEGDLEGSYESLNCAEISGIFRLDWIHVKTKKLPNIPVLVSWKFVYN